MSEAAIPFKPKKSVALSGVAAGNTALYTIGRTGNDLHYRGYDILDFATSAEFEEIAHLLVHGKLPNMAELAAYKAKLKSLRGIPTSVKAVLEQIPSSAHPMDVMRTAVSALTGAISQVPSAVSAIKVDGKRAYARVRAGEDVVLAARDVVVSRFDVLEVRRAEASDGTAVVDLDVAVTCSSGTYVRALARDLGAALGTGGHLTALRRTRVGAYQVRDATALGLLEAAPTDRPLEVLPLVDSARAMFPTRVLTEQETTALSYGQRLDPAPAASEPVAALSPSGELVALLETRGGRAAPVLVFAPA